MSPKFEFHFNKNYLVPLIFLLLCSFVAYSYQEYTTNKNYRVLTTENGLSNNTVYAIHQDSNGYIWIGTKDGLNKYDGYNFTIYRNSPEDPNSLSYNEVWDLAEDEKGNIWIATNGGGISKFDPRTEQFTSYIKYKNRLPKVSHNNSTSIFVDSQNRIWSGNWNGLDLYNPKKDRFESVIASPEDKAYENAVYQISEDQYQNIWISTDGQGLLGYNPEQKKVISIYNAKTPRHVGILRAPTTSFLIDEHNDIWVQQEEEKVIHIDQNTQTISNYSYPKLADFSNKSSYKGFIYKDKTGRILMTYIDQGVKYIVPDLSTKASKLHNLIPPETLKNYTANTILEDATGSLWIGTENQGIIYSGAATKPFQHLSKVMGPKDFTTESVTKIIEDQEGQLWFGSTDFGIMKMNPNTGEITYKEELLSNTEIDLSKLKVLDLTEGSKGEIWISTIGYGVIRLNPKTLQYNTYSLSQDGYSKDNSKSKNPDKELYNFDRIEVTDDGYLWLSIQMGGILCKLNPETLKNELYSNLLDKDDPRYLPGYYINCLFKSDENKMLVGFSDGGLYEIDHLNKTVKPVGYLMKKSSNPNAQNVTCIFKDKSNTLWIGTANGLYKKEPDQLEVQHYNIADGLANSYISNIIQDLQGDIWVSTNNGISKLMVKTQEFKNYTINDGLKQTEYHIGANCLYSKNGMIYFGGQKGTVFFNPEHIKSNTNVPPIVITDFMKSGKSENFVNVKGMDFINEIELLYHERDINIKLAALDYTNPNSNKYQYFLEGYNKDWRELIMGRQITFTNLDHGTYFLRLKGSNNDGIWSEKETPLKITILPPWWRTWWAYAMYFAIIAILMLGLHMYRMNRLEALKLKEINDTRSRLFANISHELRTPLTLINGPLEKIMNDKNLSLDEETKQDLQMAQENTKSLKNMVDDILNLSKLEAKKLQVKNKTVKLDTFLQDLANKFSSLAARNEINFEQDFTSLEHGYVSIDNDKLEKIINNLLSNAFKYTPSNGTVQLTGKHQDAMLKITVKDNGQGISSKDLPLIFDRYFQTNDPKKPLEGGSGIGLSLVKEFTELMGGNVSVKSTLKKGSTFEISLPHIPVENPEKIEEKPEHKVKEIILSKSIPTLQKVTTKEHTILIVEDNYDMQQYIASILTEEYHLIRANHGQEALDYLKLGGVDLIVSDIMMPVMDGYTLLDNIKNHKSTQGIPFIMLTAMSDPDYRLKALTIGADDYMSKPFLAKELLARIDNLLERYEERKSEIEENKKEAPQNNTNAEDEVNTESIHLVEQVAKVIENNIENPEFKLVDLSEKFNLGERQLRRKIKVVTGLSPKKFQQEIALQKARNILENNTYENVKAVALSSGFNHTTRFNRLYEARFGKKPSDYFE